MYHISTIYDHHMHDVPGGKVSILDGHSIGHSKQKNVDVHVSYSKGYKYLRFSFIKLNSNNRILFLVYIIGGNVG